MKEQSQLTEKQIWSLRDEFIDRLGTSNARHQKRPFVIVIGGAPGSGKTTTADKMAYLSGSLHVQANSVRQLLREHGLPWGKNIHLIIEEVIRKYLTKGFPVVLDGMMTKKEERQLVKKVAREYEYGAPVFFNAVLCNPKIAEERARKRYADGKVSTFEDWRCDPEKFEGPGSYIESIGLRTRLLETEMDKIPDSPQDRIWPIDNNGTERDLVDQIQPVWEHIRKNL